VKVPQDERFRIERARFHLRFVCEECALFDPETAACAHGFPTDEHRKDRLADPDALIVFCKEFDLM